MKPKISIIMPYYNRIQLLYFSLRTFSFSSLKDECEIIIVDDASEPENAAAQIIDKFKLNIKVVTITKEEKKETQCVNPCVKFNMAAKIAEGEILIIQSPECMHYGDVMKKAYEQVTGSNYVLFSVKAATAGATKRLQKIQKLSYPQLWPQVVEILGPELAAKNKWYNHPRINPTEYHFISALTRETYIKTLGGFDERYGTGFCFDDNEFIERIKRSPLTILNLPPDEVCGVHLFHPVFSLPLGNKDAKWKQNYQLFHNVTKKEKGWKVNQ